MSERLPAWVYHVERIYGEKVAQCPRCKSEDGWNNHARASWNCNGCGWEITSHALRWVPKDVRVRLPEEIA